MSRRRGHPQVRPARGRPDRRVGAGQRQSVHRLRDVQPPGLPEEGEPGDRRSLLLRPVPGRVGVHGRPPRQQNPGEVRLISLVSLFLSGFFSA
jgi:hypothetical protein